MKTFYGYFLCIMIFLSCSFSNGKVEQMNNIVKSKTPFDEYDTIRIDSAVELICSNSEILIRPNLSGFSTKESPRFEVVSGKLKVKSKSVDTTLASNKYYFQISEGSFKFNLAVNNFYTFENGIFICSNELGSFSLIDNSWIPKKKN